MEGIYATRGILCWGCTFGGVYIHWIYSHAEWSYRRRFRFLLLCPLSVERYYFSWFVDGLQLTHKLSCFDRLHRKLPRMTVQECTCDTWSSAVPMSLLLLFFAVFILVFAFFLFGWGWNSNSIRKLKYTPQALCFQWRFRFSTNEIGLHKDKQASSRPFCSTETTERPMHPWITKQLTALEDPPSVHVLQQKHTQSMCWQTDEAKVRQWAICSSIFVVVVAAACVLSLIHIWRCRRDVLCRSRWSPYH